MLSISGSMAKNSPVKGENNEVRTLIFGPEGLEVTTHDSAPATHP